MLDLRAAHYFLILMALLAFSTSSEAAESESRFSYGLGLEYSRGFDEFSDGHQSADISLSYKFWEKYSLSVSTGYDYRFSKYEDETDPAFNFSATNIWLRNTNFNDEDTKRGVRVVAGLGLLLPTSRAAKKAGLQAGFLGQMNLIKEFRPQFFDLVFSNQLYVYSHEYETTNRLGTNYNSQYNLVNGLSVTYHASDQFQLSVGGSLINSQLYSGKAYASQKYSASISYSPTRDLGLYARTSTKDRLVSNNDLLDDDNTQYGVGLSYSF